MFDHVETQDEFLERTIPLKWNELKRSEKNELVHIWVMGKPIGGPVPNYCGDWNAAFTAVKRLQHARSDMFEIFWRDLGPIWAWSPEDLVLRVMRAFGYRDHLDAT